MPRLVAHGASNIRHAKTGSVASGHVIVADGADCTRLVGFAAGRFLRSAGEPYGVMGQLEGIVFELDEKRILNVCLGLKKEGADGFLEILLTLAEEYLAILDGEKRTKEENETLKRRIITLSEL